MSGMPRENNWSEDLKGANASGRVIDNEDSKLEIRSTPPCPLVIPGAKSPCRHVWVGQPGCLT